MNRYLWLALLWSGLTAVALLSALTDGSGAANWWFVVGIDLVLVVWFADAGLRERRGGEERPGPPGRRFFVAGAFAVAAAAFAAATFTGDDPHRQAFSTGLSLGLALWFADMGLRARRAAPARPPGAGR